MEKMSLNPLDDAGCDDLFVVVVVGLVKRFEDIVLPEDLTRPAVRLANGDGLAGGAGAGMGAIGEAEKLKPPKSSASPPKPLEPDACPPICPPNDPNDPEFVDW